MSNPLPDDTKQAIDDYVQHGECGDFLSAALGNRFVDTVCLADDHNLEALPEIAFYIWNHIPSACWGSLEKVNAWQKARRAERGIA